MTYLSYSLLLDFLRRFLIECRIRRHHISSKLLRTHPPALHAFVAALHSHVERTETSEVVDNDIHVRVVRRLRDHRNS